MAPIAAEKTVSQTMSLYGPLSKGTPGAGAWYARRSARESPQAGTTRPAATSPRSQRPGKAEFVPVRVANVEIALAPRRVARGEVRRQAGLLGACILSIDIVDVEDGAAPPRQGSLSGNQRQVQIAATGAEAGERRVRSAVVQFEPERPVERDRACHVVRRQGDRADAFDHARSLPARLAAKRFRSASSRGTMPSGLVSTTMMISTPYRKKCSPGSAPPKRPRNSSPQGISTSAASSGPSGVPRPPIVATSTISIVRFGGASSDGSTKLEERAYSVPAPE